jgi:hypothetical protein
MSPGSQRNNGNKAVALLATCLVVLGGAITFCVIALSNESRLQQQNALGIAGVTTLGIVLILWLLRDRSGASNLSLVIAWLSRKPKKRVAYKAKLQRPVAPNPTGGNAPPSAESVRSINAGKNVWNPAPAATRNDPDPDA